MEKKIKKKEEKEDEEGSTWVSLRLYGKKSKDVVWSSWERRRNHVRATSSFRTRRLNRQPRKIPFFGKPRGLPWRLCARACDVTTHPSHTIHPHAHPLTPSPPTLLPVGMPTETNEGTSFPFCPLNPSFSLYSSPCSTHSVFPSHSPSLSLSHAASPEYVWISHPILTNPYQRLIGGPDMRDIF